MRRIIAGLDVRAMTPLLESGLGHLERLLLSPLGGPKLVHHSIHLHDLLVHQVEMGGQLAEGLLTLGVHVPGPAGLGVGVRHEADPVRGRDLGDQVGDVVAEGVGVAEEEDAVTCYLSLNTAGTAH